MGLVNIERIVFLFDKLKAAAALLFLMILFLFLHLLQKNAVVDFIVGWFQEAGLTFFAFIFRWVVSLSQVFASVSVDLNFLHLLILIIKTNLFIQVVIGQVAFLRNEALQLIEVNI